MSFHRRGKSNPSSKNHRNVQERLKEIEYESNLRACQPRALVKPEASKTTRRRRRYENKIRPVVARCSRPVRGRRSQGYVRRRTNESPRESQICKARTWEERIHTKERVRAFARARARVFSRSERAFNARMQRQLAAYKRDVVFSTPRRSNASPLLFLQGCAVTADVSCYCLPIARSRRWLVISDGKFVRVTPAM